MNHPDLKLAHFCSSETNKKSSRILDVEVGPNVALCQRTTCKAHSFIYSPPLLLTVSKDLQFLNANRFKLLKSSKLNAFQYITRKNIQEITGLVPISGDYQ